MGKGSSPRPFAITQDEYASNWDSIFRKDAGAKDGPTIQEGTVSAGSELEANRNGGQGKAQDGRAS